MDGDAMSSGLNSGAMNPVADGFEEGWLVRAADVAPARVDWLWPGRIALGKVTLLAGDPGLGKSLLTIDFAARVTRGAEWPGEGSEGSGFGVQGSDVGEDEKIRRAPGTVVVLNLEDDISDTIRPRLDVHEADCRRVLFVQTTGEFDAEGKYMPAFQLERDLHRLEAMLDRIPTCRLVVIDPIMGFLGRAIESSNTEVRGVMDPLAALAKKRNLAVIAVTHLRKKDGATMYRALGSLAFVAASRAAWLVCSDPADEGRRLFLPLKNNLAGERRGLAFRIESRGPHDAPFVCWEEQEVSITADTALRPPRLPGRPNHEGTAVIEWLAELLASGPQPAAAVREAAEAHGFNYGTLRRAFRALEGKAVRQENGERGWLWGL
jgi:putative DNA primase/helicase